MNHARKERRFVKSRLKDIVNLGICMKNITVHLGLRALNGRRHIKEREPFRIGIPLLACKLSKIQRPDIYSWRSSRFHPGHRNPGGRQLLGNSIACLLPYSAPFKGMTAYEHFSVKKGSGGQNKCFTVKNSTCNCLNSADFFILKEKTLGKICVNL